MRWLAVLVALLVPATASAAVPRPDDDPFYVAPANLAETEPGAILATREIDVTALGLPLPVDGHQLLYRTQDTQNQPEATVATVLIPQNAAPAAGRPLLAYQPAEDSLTRECASSYEIRQGSNPELAQALIPLFGQGAAVVVPDYEGPESQWVAGKQAAHAVLDAVRATQAFAPAGTGTKVAMWGYSGGGHATAWAAELQPRYAPELNVVGAAHGGAPYDLPTTVANLDGSPFAGILLAATVGISRAFPEMRFDDALNERGKAMKATIGEQCIEQFALAYPGAKLDDFTVTPNAKELPRIKRVIERNDLGRRTPGAPLYVYHAATDELNPIAGTDAIVDTYCRDGATLEYVREPLGEHIEYAVRGSAGAAAWIADRFAGKPAPSDCPPVAVSPRCTLTLKLPRRRGERIRRAVIRVAGRRIVRRGRNLRRITLHDLPQGRQTLRLKLRTSRGTRTVVVRRRCG